MATYSPLPAIERLQTAQTRPLIQRCYLMTEILTTSSTKELKSALPYILHEIFDFEKDETQGWQLDRILRSYSLELFNQIRRLLAPDGPLMKLINCLQTDPSAVYEFPLKYIPAPSRHMIEDGAIPAFYANKLQGQSFTSAVLMLNAFELYMFHLAYALVSPMWQARNQGWADLYEFIYPIIIDDLLVYFLPCDKSSLPSVPYFTGSHISRPTVGQTSPSRTGYMPSPTHSTSPSHQQHPHLQNQHQQQQHHRSLFKSSFVQAQRQHQQSLPVLDQAEAEVWRSETFLQVITEFWLNQNTFGGNDFYPIRGALQEHFMPSLNQVKMVRLLVKYLHHFTNSATSTSLTSSPAFQQVAHAPLDQFKRLVVPHILQRKLYNFLRHGFDRWPLDSCFRMVLETWLSYIQPWRYTDYNSRNQLDTQASDTDVNKSLDERWDTFVEENLLFYTVLTSEFIPRIHRMDLTSPYSAYMVYRVSRILNLPNLVDLILKAEQELFGSSLGQTSDLGGSYLSAHSLPQLTLPSQMMDLEGPGFQYFPFCGTTMCYNIHRVVLQLSDALEQVRAQQQANQVSQKDTKNQGFFASIFSTPNSASDGPGGNLSSPEHRRLPTHLQQAINNFCHMFGMARPASVIDSSLNSSVGADNSRFLADGDSTEPDCVQTAAGLKLTDIGRKQLMNRERKFEEFYVGGPDLQPVRSYENATLVRLLYHFCCFINSYFRAEFTDLFNRSNFAGRFARVYLMPPATQVNQIQGPVSCDHRWHVDQHQQYPRLSLRSLASYKTLAHLALAYILVWALIGWGPTGFLLLAAFAAVGYGVLVALIRSLTGEKGVKNN